MSGQNWSNISKEEMMQNPPTVQEEVEHLLNSTAPEIAWSWASRTRGFSPEFVDVVCSLVVSGCSLGVFGGLWKVFETFLRTHSKCKVKLTYVSTNGTTVEQEFTQLTVQEAQKIVEANPPKGTGKLIVLFRENQSH